MTETYAEGPAQHIDRADFSVLFNTQSTVPTCRSDVALLCVFAELYLAPKPAVQAFRADTARRRQRFTTQEAMDALSDMGLASALFKGDLRDLEDAARPVIAIMKSSVYLLLLMVERQVVIARTGSSFHPYTISRAEFNRHWTQAWIGVLESGTDKLKRGSSA